VAEVALNTYLRGHAHFTQQTFYYEAASMLDNRWYKKNDNHFFAK